MAAVVDTKTSGCKQKSTSTAQERLHTAIAKT